MSRRVFITGGTGFVGSHAVEAYLAAGWQVRAWVRNPNRLTWLSGLSIEIASGAFFDRKAVSDALQGCDVVVHCAGVTKTARREEFFRINADAVRELADAARAANVRRFVLCSTHAASGPAIDGVASHEQDPPHPLTDYGRSKLAGERMLQAAAGKMEWIILRPPSILGPRDEQFVPLFRGIKRFGLYPVLGSRSQRYSYIYVRDFVKALLLAGDVDRGVNELYFVAHDETLVWSRAAALIASLSGKNVRALSVPAFAAHIIGHTNNLIAKATGKAALLSSEKVREMLASGWVCSTEKIQRAWGFQCEYSTENALRETYEFYRQTGRL